MAMTDYCEYGEIRAALGVNDVELSDAVLSLPIYEIGLVRELNKVSTSLPAAFSSAKGEDPQSAEAKGLVDAVHMFAAYSVAKQVGASLSTFAPKDVGDGKATIARFSGQPYTETMDNVKAALADARSALEDAFAVYNGQGASSAVDVSGFFVAGQRLTDPVTGS